MNQSEISRIFSSEQKRYCTWPRAWLCDTRARGEARKKAKDEKARLFLHLFFPGMESPNWPTSVGSPHGQLHLRIGEAKHSRAAGHGNEGGATALTRARLVQFLSNIWWRPAFACPFPSQATVSPSTHSLRSRIPSHPSSASTEAVRSGIHSHRPQSRVSRGSKMITRHTLLVKRRTRLTRFQGLTIT